MAKNIPFSSMYTKCITLSHYRLKPGTSSQTNSELSWQEKHTAAVEVQLIYSFMRTQRTLSQRLAFDICLEYTKTWMSQDGSNVYTAPVRGIFSSKEIENSVADKC